MFGPSASMLLPRTIICANQEGPTDMPKTSKPPAIQNPIRLPQLSTLQKPIVMIWMSAFLENSGLRFRPTCKGLPHDIPREFLSSVLGSTCFTNGRWFTPGCGGYISYPFEAAFAMGSQHHLAGRWLHQWQWCHAFRSGSSGRSNMGELPWLVRIFSGRFDPSWDLGHPNM